MIKIKKAGNNSFLKQYNEAMILDLIRIKKTISRSDLSRMTGLSATSAGVTISSLINKGYIHEVGIGESKGGRRPVLLELLPKSFYSFGFDIDVDSIIMVLIDVTGEIIHEEILNIGSKPRVEIIVDYIENMIQTSLDRFSIETGKVIGIGVAVPGIISSENRNIILAPNLGWENVSFSKYMKKFEQIPAYVENEAMATAVCENWIGSCQDDKDFICINIKSGIGAGIFAGGRLYRGANGSAGEVGHIVVDENGPKCGCGNFGCLETLASTTRIIENTKKLLSKGINSKLNCTNNLDNLDINKIICAAKESDEFASHIFVNVGRYLGIAISNVINTLNPSKIVLGKEFIHFSDLAMGKIKEVVAGKALKAPASKAEIVTSLIGEKSSALGAAIIPLKTLFQK